MNISLYPEKSREDLELDYHHMVATVWEAAADILRLEGQEATDELIIRKLDTLMRRSEDRAAKSAAVRYQRALMAAKRSAKPVVHLLLAALLLSGVARAQTKPVDFALYAADASIRALDVTSTHALLASPCRCFKEDDPLSPNTRRVLPLLAFQAGMSWGVIEGGRRLAAHGHPRLGRLLLLADIANEVWAVQHNERQHAPHTSGLTPTPGTTPVRIGR